MPKERLENIRSTLNQIFEQRDALFPKRDLQNTASMREALTAYAVTLRDLQEPTWRADVGLLESALNIAENGVFICGYMKNGTSLLFSLLDGHPELVVMPGDSHMMNRIHKQRNMSYAARLKDWDIYWINRLVNPRGQKPFWIMGEDEKPYLNFLHYLDYWLEHLPPADRTPFLAVVLAFYCANPKRPVNPRFWIEKTPGNESKVDQILDLLPSARFIHIMRDPQPNMGSLKRLHKLRGWNWNTATVASSLRRSIETGLLNQKRLGKNNYHILRYEDLVTNPEAEIKKLTIFLGITMDEILLFPTVNRLPTKSNTMFKDRQSYGEILSVPGNQWRNELDPFEQKAVMVQLYSTAKQLGYQWNTMSYYQACVYRLISRLFTRLHRRSADPLN